jgi:hypothetical protein
VVLADTQLDEGDVGRVIGFSDDGRQPIISFDGKPSHTKVVDKWGAARVVPKEFELARRRPAKATGRTTPKSKKIPR